jgi:hypothetical protein
MNDPNQVAAEDREEEAPEESSEEEASDEEEESVEEEASDEEEESVEEEASDEGGAMPDDSMRFGPYTLEDFKADVRTWIELDDSIKTLQSAIRERRQEKVQLTKRVMEFMDRHDIEDLNTKRGRIRYKTNVVRAPLSQSAIKERISTFFGGDASTAAMLTRTLFEDGREPVERSSLRRLK